MTPESSQYNTLTLRTPPEVLSLSLFLFLCPLKNGGHFSSALVSSMLSFYSFYVHKFVAVAGTKPFLERQEHSNIFSKHLKCEASRESQKN